ncbi:MAG: hypothetical protein K5697_03915 [Lachnospiraceae bacterium]|nr:hypothetical protein [Lachnospiraceae bacterium]
MKTLWETFFFVIGILIFIAGIIFFDLRFLIAGGLMTAWNAFIIFQPKDISEYNDFSLKGSSLDPATVYHCSIQQSITFGRSENASIRIPDDPTDLGLYFSIKREADGNLYVVRLCDPRHPLVIKRGIKNTFQVSQKLRLFEKDVIATDKWECVILRPYNKQKRSGNKASSSPVKEIS